jgi:hypothetical protein
MKAQEKEKVPTFIEVLGELDDGRVDERLTTLYAATVRSVMDANMSGSITLTLKLKPLSGCVVVKATMTAKAPAPACSESMFFVTKAGGLSRNDPRQLTLRHVEEEGTVRLFKPIGAVSTEVNDG